MTKIYWRIHQVVVDRVDTVEKLLSDRGDVVQIVDGHVLEIAPPLEHVGASMAITSLQDARFLLKQKNAPRMYFDLRRYNVSYWLPRMDIGVPVLNKGCIFVPAGLLKDVSATFPVKMRARGCARNSLFDRVFIRPDSGLKPFTGQSLDINDVRNWEEIAKSFFMSCRNVSPDLMLCVSPWRSLNRTEWRFWIVNRKVSAYAPYGWGDNDCGEEMPWMEAPAGAIVVAELLAQNAWQPDIAYVADVVQTQDGVFWLNEINAASTSGIYNAPLEPLFDALRDAISREISGELTILA